MMDRPHIIYNKETGKFVCWLKIMQNDNRQSETVLTADSLTGPYTVVRERLQPLGMSAGDFDLAVAGDGKAYYYFERVHSETICADLTADYTDVTGYYSTHFPHHDGPPHVREATAHFMRGKRHYLITSGTTGYFPNPSEVAVGDTWHGPFTVQGDPHVGDASRTSFHSQISSVYKVAGKKDLYIAVADRWLPDYMDVDYEVCAKTFELLFGGREDAARKAEIEEFIPLMHTRFNTSRARYVWLPLRFDGDRVYIEWHDEWRWENFD